MVYKYKCHGGGQLGARGVDAGPAVFEGESGQLTKEFRRKSLPQSAHAPGSCRRRSSVSI